MPSWSFERRIFASSEIRNVISKGQKQISVSVLSKSSQLLPLFVTRALRNNNRMAKKYEGKLVIRWESVVVYAFSSIMLNKVSRLKSFVTVIADYFYSFRNDTLTWSCLLRTAKQKSATGKTRSHKGWKEDWRERVNAPPIHPCQAGAKLFSSFLVLIAK